MENKSDEVKFLDQRNAIDNYGTTDEDEIQNVDENKKKKAEDDSVMATNSSCLKCKGCYVPKRFVVTAMTSLGMLLTYAMRSNFGVTVITILDNSAHMKVHEDAMFNLPTVQWDTREIGFLHAVFYIGYIITHIPGGYLTTIWASHRIFGGCILFSAVMNLLLPVFVEEVGYIGTCCLRGIQGMGEGLLYPACYGLLRHWSTTKERGRLVSAVLTGSYAGAIIGFPMAGFITHYIGWQYVYYVCGGVCIVWYFSWLCLVYEKPSHHTSISDEEYNYLCDAQGSDVIDYVNLKIPWAQILTSLPVIALCICHFARNWIFVFMLTNEPYYLNNFGFSIAESGSYSSIPHIVKVLVAFGSGYMADLLLLRCSPTVVRKLLTGIGFSIVALSFFILTFCETGVSAILVLCIAAGFFAVSISGWQINHYDLSARYAGILVSVTSAFGTLGAIAVPLVTGELTKDRTLDGWDDIFYVTMAIFLFSALVFVIFGSGNEQPWARPPSNIKLVQKIDPLARKPYKTFVQQKSADTKDILQAESIDGKAQQKDDKIHELVDRLTEQLSAEEIKKDS
ncbi:vesicular glutamate transporter 3-like isoform X2 [Mytilus edulis]|uniref:vesicular glutamate transporter 3-like isoform X2 n=1 Tax=Mytilus edulis TaxID=6550 RepID=UPI0039EF3FE8